VEVNKLFVLTGGIPWALAGEEWIRQEKCIQIDHGGERIIQQKRVVASVDLAPEKNISVCR
jgi:hypothetical protein